MAEKYCRLCGEKLVISNEFTESKFDEDTGQKVEIKHVVTRCPNFVSGYSDRYYQHHDMRVNNLLATATAIELPR